MAAISMSAKKLILSASGIIVLIIVLLALRPVPEPTLENCLRYRDVVLDIEPGKGEKDIVIKLMKDNHYYYINRGLENGLKLEELRKKLLYKDAQLLVIRHWTPLDPAFHSRHIAQVDIDGEVIYTEIK